MQRTFNGAALGAVAAVTVCFGSYAERALAVGFPAGAIDVRIAYSGPLTASTARCTADVAGSLPRSIRYGAVCVSATSVTGTP